MISIIIPTLNEEKYLPPLLESIKKQSFKDYEIIISDGGSKDDTIKIAKEYGCVLAKGGQVSAGRNNGAKIAKGDVLLFLDADVILPPAFLKNASKKFKDKNLGVAGFVMKPLYGNKMDKFIFNFFDKFALLAQRLSPHVVAAIMCKKNVHERIGGFDEDIKLLEDVFYARQAAKIANYRFINEPFFTSVRRYEKDGRIPTYIRYALAELHVVFIGPVKSDIFKYRFDHYKE